MAEIIKENFEQGLIIKLSGQFTGGDETDKLDNEFSEISNSSTPFLIVDLSNVTFLGSIAIGKIVKHHSEFNEKNGKIVFFGFNNIIQNVLKSTKVWNIIITSNSFEEAKGMF